MAQLQVGQLAINRKTGSRYKIYFIDTVQRSKAIPVLGDRQTLIFLELDKKSFLSTGDQQLATVPEQFFTRFFLPIDVVGGPKDTVQ